MDVWQPYTLDLRADYRWDYRGMLYHLDTLDAKVVHYPNPRRDPHLETRKPKPSTHGARLRERQRNPTPTK